jgi:purine-binding chemotaxis protein CheW
MEGMHVQLRVGQERYAVSIEDAREVLDLAELTPIPGASTETLGLCNLGGEILPVFDLAAKLGVAHEGHARRLLVVEHSHRRAGLAVDEVLDVGILTQHSQPPNAPFLQAVTVVDAELVGVLAVGELLDAIQDRKSRGAAA